MSRRRVLTGLVGAAAATAVLPALSTPAIAAVPRIPADVGRLKFKNLHTGEMLDVTYREEGHYLPDALGEINHILRDHRTGDIYEMDRELMDLLTDLAASVDRPMGTFNIISGYRSPKTNATLAAKSNGVARKSYHMRGMAIDVSMDGVDLMDLHKAALRLKRGGVGDYPRSGFIHVDTGRVRSW
ncbi:DUF882 domain-containing protein [Caenispirillum salinarum]|nr:DUF882 domain-containing protein [Caenispirillum salinarum]